MTDAAMTFGLPAYPAYYMENDDLADERAIVDRLIRGGLERGYEVSVHDGEERVISRSRSYENVTSYIALTDMTVLSFFNPSVSGPAGKGRVILIHGNGDDVVHDHTDNDMIADLVALATGEDYRV